MENYSLGVLREGVREVVRGMWGGCVAWMKRGWDGALVA